MSVYEGYKGRENMFVAAQPSSRDEDGMEEEKALNVDDSFHRNISDEESESRHSSQCVKGGAVSYWCRSSTLAVASCVLLTLTSLSISIFTCAKYHEMAVELHAAKENRGKVCLPCDEKAIQHREWTESSRRFGECCLKLEDILTSTREIAEQITSLKVKEAMAKDLSRSAPYSSTNRVSAHVGLSSKKWPNNKFTYITNDTLSMTHTTPGLSVTSGSNGDQLYVEVGGYYLVYGVLTAFYTNSELDEISQPDATNIIQVMLKKPHVPGETVILKSANMKWATRINQELVTQTNSVSGLVYIPGGSKLTLTSPELHRYRVQGGLNPFKNCKPNECYIYLLKL